MGLSAGLFLILLAGVGLTRLAELAISRRHQRVMGRLGIRKEPDPHYRWMVVLHAGVLAGAAVEIVWLNRPWIPLLAATMFTLFCLAFALRWWTIRTLGTHWNVEVMESASLGIVSTGPFRWIRHPNYLGVFVEMTALPLIHSAWFAAVASAIGNLWVLGKRLRVEEPILEADPTYRVRMAGKPRFLPRLF